MRVNGNYYHLPANRNSFLRKAQSSKNVTFSGINWASETTRTAIKSVARKEEIFIAKKFLLLFASYGTLSLSPALLAHDFGASFVAMILLLFPTLIKGIKYADNMNTLRRYSKRVLDGGIPIGQFVEEFNRITGQQLKNIQELHSIR